MGKISKSKKTLALVMALVMAFTIVPFGAWGVIKASAESTDQQAAGFKLATELLDGHEYIIASWDGTKVLCDDNTKALAQVRADEWNPDTATLAEVSDKGALWTYHRYEDYDPNDGKDMNYSQFSRKSSWDNSEVYLDFHWWDTPPTSILREVHTYNTNACELKVESDPLYPEGGYYKLSRKGLRKDGQNPIANEYLGFDGSAFKVGESRNVRIYESTLDVPDSINLPITIRDMHADGILQDLASPDEAAFSLSSNVTDQIISRQGKFSSSFLNLTGDKIDNHRTGLTQKELKNGKLQYSPYTVIYVAHVLSEIVNGNNNWWTWVWFLEDHGQLGKDIRGKFMRWTNGYGAYDGWTSIEDPAYSGPTTLEYWLHNDYIKEFQKRLNEDATLKANVNKFFEECSENKYATLAGARDAAKLVVSDAEDIEILADYAFTVSHASQLTYNRITNNSPSFESKVVEIVDDTNWKRELSGWHNETVSGGATIMDVAYFLLNRFFEDDDAQSYTKTVTNAAKELQLKRKIEANGEIKYFYDSGYASDWGHNGGVIRNTSFASYNTPTDTSPNFHPIDTLEFGNTQDNKNYGYTLQGQGKFVYNSKDNLYFTFQGDDDTFLYINNKRVDDIDLGGAHGPESGTVYLNTVAGDLGLEEGKIYDFDFFYMERNPEGANLKVETNIKIMPSDLVPQKTAYQDIDCAVEDMIPSGAKVPNGTQVWYEFGATNEDVTGNGAKVENLRFVDKKLGYEFTPNVVMVNGMTDTYQINDFLTSRDEDGNEMVHIGYYIDGKDDNGKWGKEIVGETKFTSVDQIKQVMATGLKADQRIYIYGIPHTVKMEETVDGVYSNNLLVSGLSVAGEGSNTVTRERRNTDITEVKVFNTQDKTFVVDYAGTLTFDKTKMFNDDEQAMVTDLYVQGKAAGEHSVSFNEDKSVTIAINHELKNAETIETTQILTQPEFQIENAAGKTAPFKLHTTKTITLVPANSVYYDANFAGINYDENWKTAIGAGSVLTGISATDEVYGNLSKDVSLKKEAHYVVGNGTTDTVTASFTFTGKGLTLYMDTNANSGKIYVKTKKADGSGKAVTDYLKIDSAGDYKEVPVVNHVELPEGWGTYTVQISANIPAGSVASLNGIRVYNPLEDGGVGIYTEAEQNAKFFELRDNMVKDVANTTEPGTGVIYIDGSAEGANIVNYEKQGPKNEIYLAPEQGIAFKLEGLNENSRVHVSARALNGDSATMQAHQTLIDVKNNVDMYYDITGMTDNNGIYTLKNTAGSVLAITNIKVTNVTGDVNFGSFDLADPAVQENIIALFGMAPVIPEEPVEPEEPENPTEPTDPEVPETPTEPETPVVPQNPFEKFFNDIRDFFNKLFGIK